MTLPTPVSPMLATLGPVPTGPGWAFEWKWDGVRAITTVADGQVRAFSRTGREITSTYPELGVLAELVHAPAVFDGELVTLDNAGRPDFGRLQERMHQSAPSSAQLAAIPVAYYVFDLLHWDNHELTEQTYERRRKLLALCELDAPPEVRVSSYYVDVAGDDLMAVAAQHGIEGVVAKRLDSTYLAGRRSKDWIKVPIRHTQEVVVCGWTQGQGRRARTLGALLLGAYTSDGLTFLGHVGTGFTDRALTDLGALLAPLEQPDSPFAGEVPSEYARNARWVRPELVGEVEYRQVTSDGRLRQPSWRGLRPDRRPAEVTLPTDW
ncbi:bifunctional non-homologous end joining protein LigD [Tamaricihabitans halophyticus]|uniref:DNA ligase (ATP) n=1 Tax=Tamaricihabitans halophyticus TaxID=1262583 RepID=A0A4R2QWB2_9PSEU|nr:non-homologous end-joining DNA ligase [Tamaricihabitans halophyticus]TCP53554.1 bifunctional non-homologous end joining protein LigD [Tamaricihabitans halophyticus]